MIDPTLYRGPAAVFTRRSIDKAARSFYLSPRSPIAFRSTGTVAKAQLTKARLTKARLMKARLMKAQVAELVDALVSGTSAARRGGSSPLLGTNNSGTNNNRG